MLPILFQLLSFSVLPIWTRGATTKAIYIAPIPYALRWWQTLPVPFVHSWPRWSLTSLQILFSILKLSVSTVYCSCCCSSNIMIIQGTVLTLTALVLFTSPVGSSFAQHRCYNPGHFGLRTLHTHPPVSSAILKQSAGSRQYLSESLCGFEALFPEVLHRASSRLVTRNFGALD